MDPPPRSPAGPRSEKENRPMPPHAPSRTLVSRPVAGLTGGARPPGDKSISHRALILGACAVGTSAIEGLLEADDVLATAGALEALGARIVRDGNGGARVTGVGVGGLYRITSYNVCYTKLLRSESSAMTQRLTMPCWLPKQC